MGRQQLTVATLICFSVVLEANAADETLRPREFAVTASELKEAMGLDIYSYAVSVQKGDKFSVMLREFPKQGAEPTILFRGSFNVSTAPRDNDVKLLFSFLKPDNTIGSALQSNLPEMNFKILATNCTPGNVAKRIAVPLADANDKVVKRWSEGAGALLRITNHGAGGDSSAFPYAELVLEREK